MCFVTDAALYGLDFDDPVRRLRALSALGRINALACIRSADHGWLGASYSCCEILTTLYFGLGRRRVVLSKGHAAAMQYACLYGLGSIDRATLLSYKDGPAGLQAHADLRAPGGLLNTGSLGQALSKTAGLALVAPGERFDVVLGDGELQEGQCFEGLQTVASRRLRNVTVIVDANGWQTASTVGSVKGIADLGRVLSGLGLEVVEVDGHDPAALLEALGGEPETPRAVIARTRKAGGSEALAAAGSPARWHGGVPDMDLARRVVDEQVALAGLAPLSAAWDAHRAAPARARAPRPDEDKAGSTGRCFAARLRERALSDERVVVLDADLAAPCGLEGLPEALGPERFVEVGIAEQDMASLAGGLALAGRIPVAHTYAAFWRRAVDQIHANQSEGKRVVYAGHYAGLGYYSDGATHQSLSDLALMRAVPGLVVADPVDRRETEELVDWALGPAGRSTYFRLRRAGAGLDDEPALTRAHAARAERSRSEDGPMEPLVLTEEGFRRCLLVTGPPATRLALDARARGGLEGWGLVVQSVFGHDPDLDRWRELFAGVERVITVEDGNRCGGLWSFACELLGGLDLAGVPVEPMSIEGFGPSFRSLEACRAHHGFVVERLVDLARRGP